MFVYETPTLNITPKKQTSTEKKKKVAFFLILSLKFPKRQAIVFTPVSYRNFGCRRGGMADALRSGRSPFTRVKVQVLSSAPLLSSRSSAFPHFFPVSFANCLPKHITGFLCFHILAKGLRPERSAQPKRRDTGPGSARTAAGRRKNGLRGKQVLIIPSQGCSYQ